ncbi:MULTISPECIES: type II toxin-antitoxin system VapB family antitoxin [unclassified Nocardia]|uniref:type II toxin-antitoxin system VapB family antitoxin n=1 Tax=unclassified Nocardia TaxID=2637762 RepID=UPI001CE40720|nr:MULTISPECIES: type II toxin-antitoxin system VapB family antitoxin [unclassified Nocardia]
MGLNIKNEKVHALVREAAERTGMSQTSVVEEAVKRMLKELDAEQGTAQKSRRERIDEILADIHRIMTPEMRALLTTDDLYDDEGMPA